MRLWVEGEGGGTSLVGKYLGFPQWHVERGEQVVSVPIFSLEAVMLSLYLYAGLKNKKLFESFCCVFLLFFFC